MRASDVLRPILLAACCLSPDGEWDLSDRHLDFLEVFSGEQSVSNGLRHLGFHGLAVDVLDNPSYDVAQPGGFLMCVRAVLSMKFGALLFLAPPCATWIWITRHSTSRSKELPHGNGQAADMANTLVMRVCYLIALASSLGVRVVVEQPSSSLLWNFPCMRDVAKWLSFEWVTADMGAYGAATKKTLTFGGTLPNLRSLLARADQLDRDRFKLEAASSNQSLHVSDVGADGKKKIYGGPGLTESAAYPIGFGCAIAQVFHDESDPPCAAAQTAWSKAELEALVIDISLDAGECFVDFSAWEQR